MNAPKLSSQLPHDERCEGLWQTLNDRPGIHLGERTLLMLEAHGYLTYEDERGLVYPFAQVEA